MARVLTTTRIGNDRSGPLGASWGLSRCRPWRQGAARAGCSRGRRASPWGPFNSTTWAISTGRGRPWDGLAGQGILRRVAFGRFGLTGEVFRHVAALANHLLRLAAPGAAPEVQRRSAEPQGPQGH